MPDPSVPNVSATHALGIYAESLASGRRVVVVGDATDGLGARMALLGARVVHVYDPDAGRAAAASAASERGVSVRALPVGDFDVRDGAFDVAIVPDLGSIGDPAALLARVRRLVGSDGVAIVGAHNADASTRGNAPAAARPLDYYELYDLVALQFANVRMIGQVPFHGVAIAELGETDGAPQVSVDTQLVPEAGAPELFIALASQHDVRLDPYAIVQLPVIAPANEPRSVRGADARVANAALAEAQLRAGLLEAQLEEQRARLTKLSVAEARGARADEIDATLTATNAKLRDAEARAADSHVRAERLALDARALEEELKRQRDRAIRLTRELEEEKKSRTKADVELGMIRKNPELATSRERVSELEESLRAAEVVASALQLRVRELEAIAGATAAAAEQLPALVSELEVTRAVAIAGEEARIQLAELAERTEIVVLRAAALEAELARRAESESDSSVTEELVRLEASLQERARAIQALERELANRERIVHQLVATLEELQHERGALHEPAQVPAEQVAAEALAAAERSSNELRRKLDALATEFARREGDAQASAWRIAELEQELAVSGAGARSNAAPAIVPATVPPPPGALAPGDLERQLATARDEIDVLKQALAQEHDARKRSESGEELARARAELERQAVLIAQLSREIDARDRAGSESPVGPA